MVCNYRRRKHPKRNSSSITTMSHSSAGDNSNTDSLLPHYALQSNTQAALLSPLRTPCRPCRNNLVSAFSLGALATMSTPDNQPLSTIDPARRDDLTNTLNNIMVQLTSINNRLNLQGSTLARHAQLLDGVEGSVASGATPSPQNGTASGVPATGAGNGGGTGMTDEVVPRTHQPPPRDYHDDLRNSFHRLKLNFPRYDDDSDPLPWLNRCESFFRGTHTLAAEQVWMVSLHLDGATAEWYYALEREYDLMSWTRFTKFVMDSL
jgi:hypothetical protein